MKFIGGLLERDTCITGITLDGVTTLNRLSSPARKRFRLEKDQSIKAASKTTATAVMQLFHMFLPVNNIQLLILALAVMAKNVIVMALSFRFMRAFSQTNFIQIAQLTPDRDPARQ